MTGEPALICPLAGNPVNQPEGVVHVVICSQAGCGWWDTYYGRCSVASFAIHFQDLQAELRAIRSAIEQMPALRR